MELGGVTSLSAEKWPHLSFTPVLSFKVPLEQLTKDGFNRHVQWMCTKFHASAEKIVDEISTNSMLQT